MSKSDDLVFDAKAKFKSTVGSVSGIFENKNKDIIKAIEQGAKSGKIKIPVDMEPDTSKVEAAKKEAAKPIETPVKLKLDASEIKALQNLPTAKAKVEFLIDKKAVNDIVAKDLNNVINKATTKMNSKLQGITSKSMASLASLDKFLPNIPELSSSKHSAMMTELKKKGLSDISQNERAQIESAYRLRSYLLDSKKEMSKSGKFITPSGNLVAPDASLSLEDYNKALNGLIKTSKNIIIASDLFGQLNKQLETNGRNIPVEQNVSSKTMRRLLGMGIKKNDPDYDPNNYAQYLLNQSLNKAGFSDNIDKIVANQTHKIELSVTNSHLDTIFKKSQNEGLSKKDYSELVNRYINKNLAELEKDILADDQFGEIALGSISDIKKRAETLNDSLKTRRKNKFIGLMSTYLAKGGSGINNEEFYKALLSDISEYDKDIDAEGKQKAIEQAVQKQLTEQKAAENKEEKSVPKKTTRKRTVKKKESIPAQTDIEEKDTSASTPPTPPKYKVVSAPKLAPIKNNDVIDETKNTADAINQSADAVIEAKKKESDTVVNSNDKIAKSEEKVAIKTVSGLKNSNSNLTETPVTPPELDGLKQLSQREFGDAQKYIKVYEDTNRTIYTLTQTYKKQFDANGNLLAEGYENAIAYYDSYEKLEGEAVKLNKKINSNYAKLDTEKYKSTDKQNPNLLKKLQDDIKSDQQDLSELHRIARLNASLPDNDYMYQNFTQALRKGSAESARSLSATRKTNRDNFNVKKDTLNTDISKQISDIESLGQAGTIAAGKLQGIQKSLSTITTPAGLENVQKQITDINEQFDSNKARESALNYVHNLEQGLTGKQNVVIGTKKERKKNTSDNFTGSIKDGNKWVGPLAGLNSKFETNYQSTSAKLDGYIADAKKLGDVGEKAANSFSTLQKNLETCYTESGLKQIQDEMKVTHEQLTASKKQADEQAAAIKNSDVAKQYDNAIDKAKEVKSLNAELLGYKKKQSQYSEGSDTYTEIGNRITETAEAAKKANTDFERLTQNDFVLKNSEALKNAGKNVEDYDKVVREMKQAQADVSGFDEKVIQANNKEAFTKQYTQAIEKVKELKSAMQDLYSFEAKGAKGQISSDDFISGFTDRFKNIKNLKKDVDEFKKNTYQNNKDDADSVLDQLLFGNYEKAFTDSEQSMSDYENKITTLMTQAYSRQRKLSNDLYKMAGNKNYSEQEYAEKMNQRNGVQATYEALKAQIKNSGKNIDSDSLISDIKNASDFDRNNILGNLKESLSSQINDFENSLKHMQNTMNLPDGIASLKEKLESAFTFENGADNLGNFKNRMQDFYQTFDSLKGSSFIQFANEFGTAFDSLTKAENSSGKVSAYTDKLNGFVESYNDIVTRFHNKEIDTSQAQDEISELASKMQDFQKVAKNYDKTNSKGTYLEGTKGLVQDTKDVETMLTEYANSIGLTSKISSSINETTGQVKMQFADISGNVVTLTGNLEKAGNAMRIISSTASKASTGMSSFGTSIKGMVSGNFKGAIADIASYVSYFQVTMKAIQQAKQGFNDFLNFQKDLTNVSYTMNLSPDQLQNLGTSAIDMAKDLSMSLDNTMDIYKIYANMNTTASEIQQTARPTAILSNLSGVDASTAADQVQGILQQFHMLEDGSTTAADASMHIVDVLDKVSGSVGIDYAKGIKIISDAVQASGQVAYDAGMSYEQLAAITAKVSERTREDGSSIGNALKTIITRTTKVGKMPQYADEVDNATLSNASASLHAIGVDVYNPDGSDRGIITVMSELKDKWDDLTDAQQAKIAFDVAATRLKASLCMKKFILE